MLFITLILILSVVEGSMLSRFANEYFNLKGIKFIYLLHCNEYDSKVMAAIYINTGVRVQSIWLHENAHLNVLKNPNGPIGILVYMDSPFSYKNLEKASKLNLFYANHSWLMLHQLYKTNDTNFTEIIVKNMENLNFTVDTDVVIGFFNGVSVELYDVFNFGKIRGNPLEITPIGNWPNNSDLSIFFTEFKYYHRWNFHKLTLRAITVILDKTRKFSASDLVDIAYTDEISAMTKISSIILKTLREVHNFRFNYTITDRWVGSPVINSTLAVTNAMHWKQQDISSTSLRVPSMWFNWMDPFFPPTTFLETKFYYRIPNTGIGDYENRFLQPLSPTVWWCCVVSFTICAMFLAFGAYVEKRSNPFSFAIFSVTAAACQQDFDDGDQVDDKLPNQGSRIVLFVIGISSMLLYNYYTSSVVSWLLNAAPPTIKNIEGLINSNLELVFEDIGYTRSWLDSPGLYYYSGYSCPKEDELRDKKVTKARRTVPILQHLNDGIALVRKGGFAYHGEPYNANQRISSSFDQNLLCELGALQMMPPSPVYIVGPKKSHYKQFFVWSMARMLERGHVSFARRRISIPVPECFGGVARALSLGQAAPAFALLAYGYLVSVFILFLEIIYDRYSKNTK